MRLHRPVLVIGIGIISSLILLAVPVSSLAIETPETVSSASNSNGFGLEPDTNSPEERQEVQVVLDKIEAMWNAHNLEGVMNYYAEDYINNDGLDKKAVTALTEDFWKTYPDAKSSSRTISIRIEGPYIAVQSRDIAVGSTAKEMPGIGTKGELQSVSEGLLYLKKVGNIWKITGDRIDYEKVRVTFGLAKDLATVFAAPEQVKSGHQYSARLDLTLPQGLAAVGSITSQSLQYPQPQPTDAWRPLESNELERVMTANTKNRNELLMATVGVTNASHNSLVGIAFLTHRLNVVPPMEEVPVSTTGTALDIITHPPALPPASDNKEEQPEKK